MKVSLWLVTCKREIKKPNTHRLYKPYQAIERQFLVTFRWVNNGLFQAYISFEANQEPTKEKTCVFLRKCDTELTTVLNCSLVIVCHVIQKMQELQHVTVIFEFFFC